MPPGAAAPRERAASHSTQPPLVLGVSGVRRNAAVAAVAHGALVGFCEQERITRTRAVALSHGRMPAEALHAAVRHAQTDAWDAALYASGECDVELPLGARHACVAHHRAHAATAVLTSPHQAAVILVCDQHGTPPVTVWQFREGCLNELDWNWSGVGPAEVYSRASQLFGFANGAEYQLEAMGRLDSADRAAALTPLLTYRDRSLVVDDALWPTLERWLAERGAVATAAAFQCALGDAMLMLVREVRSTVDIDVMCLGGGLFYNTYLNTRVATSGGFSKVFVPINPGNPGIAAGAALLCAQQEALSATEVSPFLGPEYDPAEVKHTLDNCKLTYEYCPDAKATDIAADALFKGQIVAWFQGRMEWGHRALGNRSILANPFVPHVLEHLNAFLKQRDRRHAFGFSVLSDDAAHYFDMPALSPFMEFEYAAIDPGLFKHIIPPGARSVRVQTVGASQSRFRDLHRAFASRSGHSVLVHTSFNGLHEPMVCSPRDAVRVFFGTGIDVMVIGPFVLRK
jgi:carbamoyltransferase